VVFGAWQHTFVDGWCGEMAEGSGFAGERILQSPTSVRGIGDLQCAADTLGSGYTRSSDGTVALTLPSRALTPIVIAGAGAEEEDPTH
jgi:hypothetical protein